MTFPTYTAVREAIATALGDIDELNVYPRARGQVNVPAALVTPAETTITFHTSTDSADYAFLIQVLVAKADLDVGQENLDPYLAPSGDQSIKEALEGSTSLDAVVDWVNVSAVTNYGVTEYAGVQYIGAQISIEAGVSG